MTPRLSVMISSTARDLPEHRKQVAAGCERTGYFPLPMENLPAAPTDAARVSLALVDQADIYIGVFAYRYGHVPRGHECSITEMEYNRALERGLPALIYLMHEDHPIRASDVEMGPGAEKLRQFKERLATAHVAGFFKSPDDLRAQVIHALTALKKPETTAPQQASDIPVPPEVYVAHPYTLLQTRRLVGRRAELNLLTDWVAAPRSEVFAAHVLSLVAIGGMGKSALTWGWFHEVAPLEMRPLAGRLWWSFYETDAGFDSFLTHALAYTTGRPRREIEALGRPEVERQLLQILNRQPFLIVLDGLERVLTAYARFDAAHLADEDLDRQTANRVLMPGETAETTGPHRLRKVADPRSGDFLRKLAQVRVGRVLVSTRLYPSDLQNAAGQPLPGCAAHFLKGLPDDDALELWRTLGVSGGRERLLPLFHRFGSHPLLVQALAGAIANYRPAPGDFERWQRDHPGFNPFGLPLTQVKSHVLQHAHAGLGSGPRKVLESLAGFRMPAGYETLAALHLGKACPTPDSLHLSLEELEGRGLVGWDRRANRYDLHPIVRGVTWGLLSGEARSDIHGLLTSHFEAVPTPDHDAIKRIEDLAPAIELFNSLIGLRRYEDALRVFLDRLDAPLLLILAANRERNELLELFFPDVAQPVSAVAATLDRAYLLTSLALGYHLVGSPGKAIELHDRALDLINEADSWVIAFSAEQEAAKWYDKSVRVVERRTTLLLGACTLFATGRLRSAEYRLLKSESSQYLPTLLALWWTRGNRDRATTGQAFFRNRWVEQSTRVEGRLLSFVRLPTAIPANYEYSVEHRHEDSVLGLLYYYFLGRKRRDGDLLAQGLRLSRDLGLVEEELYFLVALARHEFDKDNPTAVRSLLADLWEAAEAGPFPLLHADGRNLLAAIERDAGNHAAASAAALHAYRLAWCDGPPFAYAEALDTARFHLQALGVPEPQLPPFDESRYPPLPRIEFRHGRVLFDPPDTDDALS